MVGIRGLEHTGHPELSYHGCPHLSTMGPDLDTELRGPSSQEGPMVDDQRVGGITHSKRDTRTRWFPGRMTEKCFLFLTVWGSGPVLWET